jgi:hypothetical protein
MLLNIDSQIRDVSAAKIISMTEVEMAHWRSQQGIKVLYHRGHYWEKLRLGFYQPINLMARLSSDIVTSPTRFCWGYRTTLSQENAINANGYVPIHVLSNVQEYDLEYLPQKRRHSLRKCRKSAKIVQLIGTKVLEEQGYEVVCSSLERTRHKKPPSKAQYLASLKNYTANKHCVILAALIGDKLSGYIDGYAVDGTAYMMHGYYDSQAMSASIVTGLNFEFVQICRRSGNIYEIIDGLHSREVASLCFYKEKMGFPVQYIPAKVCINPIVEKYIRWRYPNRYYRLTGHD